MGVNSLAKTVTRQRRGCDLNPGRLHSLHDNHSATEPVVKWYCRFHVRQPTHQTMPIQCLDIARFQLQGSITGIPGLPMPAQLEIADSQVQMASKHQASSSFTGTSLT